MRVFRWNRRQKFYLAIAAAIGLVALTAGCGSGSGAVASTSAPVSAPAAPSCASGQALNAAGTCVNTTNLAQTCIGPNTSLITNSQGVQLCKVTANVEVLGLAGIINPPTVGGPFAQPVMQVSKGDTLTYTGSGTWGYYTTSSYDLLGFIPIQSFQPNCSNVDLTGMSSGTQLTYDSGNSGLYGTDGTQNFYLGTGVTNQTINNNGTLGIGLNISPVNPSSPSVAGFSACNVSLTFTIQHCFDQTNSTYSCSS